MKFWRISNYIDLQGLGGLKVAGRWHNRGIPVVYLAESPSLAMLEVLVHHELKTSEVPNDYKLLEIQFDGRKGISRLDDESVVTDDVVTRAIGDEWLQSFSSAVLRVPSVIVPQSYNYLLNPRHPLASHAKIINVTSHPYDERLF